MNLVFVVLGKNIKDAVVLYKKKIKDVSAINPNARVAIKNLFDFKI